MKAIGINGEMIIRETERCVDRDANSVFIRMKMEPKYGVVLGKSHKTMTATFDFHIEKSLYPTLWSRIKDANNEVVVAEFRSMLDKALLVCLSRRTVDDREIGDTSVVPTTDEGYMEMQANFPVARFEAFAEHLISKGITETLSIEDI